MSGASHACSVGVLHTPYADTPCAEMNNTGQGMGKQAKGCGLQAEERQGRETRRRTKRRTGESGKRGKENRERLRCGALALQSGKQLAGAHGRRCARAYAELREDIFKSGAHRRGAYPEKRADFRVGLALHHPIQNFTFAFA